jgi:hypothetical protein
VSRVVQAETSPDDGSKWRVCEYPDGFAAFKLRTVSGAKCPADAELYHVRCSVSAGHAAFRLIAQAFRPGMSEQESL